MLVTVLFLCIEGVSKTYLAEILDDSNSLRGEPTTLLKQYYTYFAQALIIVLTGTSYFGVVGGFGRSIGPLIGGYLSHPDQTFPRIFSADSILARFPFSLPCLFIFTYSLIIIALTYAYLPETITFKSKAGFLTVPQAEPDEGSSNSINKSNKEAMLASSSMEKGVAGGAGAKNRVCSNLEEEEEETNLRSSVGSLLKDPAILTVVIIYGLVSLIQVSALLGFITLLTKCFYAGFVC